MKKMLTVMISVFMYFIMILPVCAKEESIQIQIPVEITLEGTEPDTPETFVIKIKADDSSYPLPEETVLEVKGASSASFDPITFDHVGIYTYTVTQIKGTNAECTYDETVYKVTVYVTNSLSLEDKLETTVLVTPNDGDKKQSAVKFHNVYKTAVITPSPSSIETPSSKKGYVNTGDTSIMYLYTGITVIACIMCIVLFCIRNHH